MIFIGVDGKSKVVKQPYVGVDGVAKRVVKAYVGVDGVAKQIFGISYMQILEIDVIEDTTVNVTFGLPEEARDWKDIKLVWKKNRVPSSVVDGKNKDISFLDRHSVVDLPNEDAKYYFVIIATDKNDKIIKSNSLNISIEKIPIKGIYNCYGVDIDRHITRENSKFSGSYSYEGNNITFNEDSDGKYWGNSNLQTINAWQCSKIPLNKSDWDYLCFDAEVDPRGTDVNKRVSLVASSIIVQNFIQPPFFNDNEVSANFVRKVIVKGRDQTTYGEPIYSVPLTTFKIDLTLLSTEQFYICLDTSDAILKVRRCWLERD